MFVQGMSPSFVWTILVPRAVLIWTDEVNSLPPLCGVRPCIVGNVTPVVRWPILPSLPTLVFVPCTADMNCPRFIMQVVAVVTSALPPCGDGLVAGCAVEAGDGEIETAGASVPYAVIDVYGVYTYAVCLSDSVSAAWYLSEWYSSVSAAEILCVEAAGAEAAYDGVPKCLTGVRVGASRVAEETDRAAGAA